MGHFLVSLFARRVKRDLKCLFAPKLPFSHEVAKLKENSSSMVLLMRIDLGRKFPWDEQLSKFSYTASVVRDNHITSTSVSNKKLFFRFHLVFFLPGAQTSYKLTLQRISRIQSTNRPRIVPEMALCSGIKRFISQLPIAQEASAKILHYVLAFFAFLSPCWTFLFIKAGCYICRTFYREASLLKSTLRIILLIP